MIGYEVYCGDFQEEGHQEERRQEERQKEEKAVILRESLISKESVKAKRTWEKQGYRFYSKEEIHGELSIPSAFAYYKQFL